MERTDIDEIIAQSSHPEELKEVLSDHFDCFTQPIAVSLGVHLKKGQTVEVITNLLRQEGINTLPYYDKDVEKDFSASIVDGTGIRSPIFEKTEDAVRYVADVYEILHKNNIETSRAFPVAKENLIPAVSQIYDQNIIDVQKNNPQETDLDETLLKFLQYAKKYLPKVTIPAGKSQESIFRGGFQGDNPYAITPHRRYRDCSYATNIMSEAITYSQAANKKGLHYKEIKGISYGYIDEFQQAPNQRFYDMAGAERPFATPEQKHTINRPEYRPDYETIIYKERNPLVARYLRIDDAVVQIADENGYFNTDGLDWGEFAKLHKPYNTGEINDYMINRVNKQLEEFPTVSYVKDTSIGSYDQPINLCGLTRRDSLKETDAGMEIYDASLNSLELSSSLDKKIKGNLFLQNCTLSKQINALDISGCSGTIMMCNMEYLNVKLPEKCNCFALSNVTFPPMDTLDLSMMKCKSMILEDVDLSAVKKVKFPKEMEELKFRYDINFSQQASFNDVKKITIEKTANIDLSKTDKTTVQPLINALKIAELRERTSPNSANQKNTSPTNVSPVTYTPTQIMQRNKCTQQDL